MSMQLKWSRTINVHGRAGKNIPADLHMEHLNRVCNGAISGLGAKRTIPFNEWGSALGEYNRHYASITP